MASTSVAVLMLSVGAAAALDIAGAPVEITTDQTVAGAIYVGTTRGGDLIVRDGATLTQTYVSHLDTGSAYIGYYDDGFGFVTVSGPGSRWSLPSFLSVGWYGIGQLKVEQGGAVDGGKGIVVGDAYEGYGTLDVRSGGKVSTRVLWVSQGGVGIAIVSGAGSEVTAEQGINVGLYNSTNGTLRIEDGGKVVAGSLSVTQTSASKGTVQIYGGVLEAHSVSAGSGTGSMIFDGGTLRARDDSFSFNGTLSDGIILKTLGGIIDTNGASFVIGSDIWGDGRLTKEGTGTLTLSGSNTYTGGTTINGGNLVVTTAPGTGPVVNNGTLTFHDASWGFDGKITGAGSVVKSGSGALTLGGDSEYTGGTIIAGGAIHATPESVGRGSVDIHSGAYLRVDNATDATLAAGPISGAGTFLKAGSGTLALDKVNTNTGLVRVVEGSLALSGNGSINSSSLLLDAGASFDISGATGTPSLRELNGQGTVRLGSRTLEINASGSSIHSGTVEGINGSLAMKGAGALTLNGTNTYSGGSTIEQGTLYSWSRGLGTGAVVNDGTLTFNQASDDTLLAGVISGTGNVRKTGAGILTLDKANTYTGTTEIAGGTLALDGAGTIGTGALLMSGGTFDISNAASGWTGNGLSGSGAISLGSNSLEVNVGGTDPDIFSGTITGGPGTGQLVKDGSGTLVLTGTNSYNGWTQINAGTLQVGNGGTTGTLGNGVAINDGTLVFNRSDSMTVSNAITGGGRLTQSGSGATTLTGASSYGGATEVEAGILIVDGSLTGNGAVNVRSGATLAGSGSVAGAVTVADGGRLFGTYGPVGFTMGNLHLASGSILSIWALPATPGTGNVFKVDGDLRLDGELRMDLGTIGYDTYNLMTYSGTLADHGLYLGATPAGWDRSQFSVIADGGVVNLVVSSTSQEQFWEGGNGTWKADTDWTDVNGTLFREWLGASAVFSGTAGVVEVEGQQDFASIKFMSDGYTLTTGVGGELAIAGSGGVMFVNGSATASVDAPVTGSGRLVKSGGGTLVLADANGYTGGTFIQDGTLRGSVSSFGTGDIENDGVLHVDQAADGELGVDISGSGQLRKSGNGVLELTGTNSYTGGTFISGWLKASADANLGAPTGDVEFSNGYLLLGSSFDLAAGRRLVVNSGSGVIDTDGHDMTVRSAMAGNAYFVKDGLGTLTLLGQSSFTGQTTINRGTLVANADSIGKGRIDNRSELVIDQGSDGAMAQAIEGAGSLFKRGAGRLNLTGTSTLTGDTYVRAGNLSVNGSLGNSLVNVEAGGTLSGTGTVGGIDVARNGILAPGNSIGTLNVASNVTFGPGSFYDVEINGAGQSDRIAATGIATLNGGTVRIFSDQGQYSLSPYTILTADGGVIGRFAGTEAGADFAFVTPTLGYGTNAVTLTLVRKVEPQPPEPPTPPTPDTPTPPVPTPVAFHSVAVSANQYRVADAIEALGEGSPLFDTVIGASASGARQAFDALSGEAHASAATTAVSDVQRVQDTILGRLRNGAENHPGNVAYPTLDPRRVTFWGEGFGSWGKIRSNGNAAGMDTSTGGFIIGAETKIDETYRIGIAGGFMSTSFDIDGRLSSGTNETVFGSVYGAAKWDAINVRLGVLFAHHDVDVSRAIALPGFSDRASASYNGTSLMAFGEVGYEFDIGKVKLEPFLGASIMRLHMDGFREDGGPAALVGYGRTYELGTTTLGIRAETQLGTDLPITLRGMVGWRHAFGDVNPAALLAFSGGVSAFEVSGIPLDQNAFVAEAGLDWQMTKDTTLGVSYAGQIGRRAQEHEVKGNFTWRFETR
jgi:fibronectin-binding autotransporter adhesin